MDPVRLPVLFESEVSFRQLVNAIPSGVAVHPRVLATYLYVRLWMECAMDARATDRPGFLSDRSARLWLQRIVEDGLPTEDWLGRMAAAGVLKLVEGGYEHQEFNLASMNAHCAGTYVKNEVRAAHHSAFNRQDKDRTQTAQYLSLQLAGYKGADGETLSPEQLRGATSVIMTLDNLLKAVPRGVTTNFWPPALVVAAVDVNTRYGATLLKNVFHFMLDHRTHDKMPRTTEQCILSFGGIIQLMMETDARGKGGRAPEPDLTLV